jgi:hypothetical protein
MNPGRAATIGLLLFATVVHAQSWEDSPGFLKKLTERSDLIIDATIMGDIDGGMSTSPIPLPNQWNFSFISCCPKVRVNRILKGEADAGSLQRIAVTVPEVYFGEPQPVPMNTPIFSIKAGDAEPAPLLAKGTRALFFLEDRPKREPGSMHKVGGEEVRYRTFDLWLGKMPFSEALARRILQWQSGK